MAKAPSGTTGSGIRRPVHVGLLFKILIAILLAGALPLLIVSLTALSGYGTASEQATNIAKEALDEKSINTLRLQAVDAADRIQEILSASIDDTLAAADLERQPEIYMDFYRSHARQISYPVFGEQSETNTQIIYAPTYAEMAYIAADGREQWRIKNGKFVPLATLRKVSLPFNTTFKNEDYFQQTASLKAGEVWVTPVMAWHTSSGLQSSNLVKNEPVGFAFSNYTAVIRFATPVFTPSGDFDGILVLSLDHRHIMEQVVHIQPLDHLSLAWADYNSGDYAFLFDFEGYTIAHPLLSRQRGQNIRGGLEAYTPEMSDDDKSKRPFNMKVSSKDVNFAAIYNKVMAGDMGYALVVNEKGVTIVRAYAPVRFSYGVYKDSGIFGGVLIGASLNRFNQAANSVGQSIRNQQQLLTISLLTIIGISLLLMSGVAFLLARGVTTPLRLLTESANEMEKGEYDPRKLEQIRQQRFQDEVSLLSGVFKTMAEAVQLREKRLKDQVQTLLIQIDQAKKEQQVKEIVDTEYFAELQRNAANLRSRRRRGAEEPPAETPPNG